MAELAQLDGISSIVEDVPVPPTLIESTQHSHIDDFQDSNAWDGPYKGTDWSVAILDTGVDKSHPMFATNRVVAEACFGSDDSFWGSTTLCPNPNSSGDSIGPGTALHCTGATGCDHGTHVAGIAAGNDNLYSGVATDSTTIAVQVFSKFPANVCGTTACVLSFVSDQIAGLEWVYSVRDSHNIAAVNMSLGGGRYFSHCDADFSATKEAIDMLRSVGIATVIASGNNSYTNSIGSPACISSAISVGSTLDTVDEVSSFSNSAAFLDILAPGSNIISSVPDGGYSEFFGTSMAAPHVAGAFALMRDKFPAASLENIEGALKSAGSLVTDSRNGLIHPRLDLNHLILTSFIDVLSDYWAAPSINVLVERGITTGCGQDKYCPESPVTRGQLAVVLLRAENGAMYTPPPATGDLFTDIPIDHMYAPWIEQLANDGVTSGCGNNNSCPDSVIDRAQLSVLLMRALLGPYNPLQAEGVFSDVPNNHWAVRYIEDMFNSGITAGCGSSNYCPQDKVSRAQLAVFVERAFFSEVLSNRTEPEGEHAVTAPVIYRQVDL